MNKEKRAYRRGIKDTLSFIAMPIIILAGCYIADWTSSIVLNLM